MVVGWCIKSAVESGRKRTGGRSMTMFLEGSSTACPLGVCRGVDDNAAGLEWCGLEIDDFA